MRKKICSILKVFTVLCMISHRTLIVASETPLLRVVTDTDTTYCSSFPDALKKANKFPYASMVLLGDVSFDGKASSQSVKTNLAIDLNGYTLGDTLSGTSLLSLGVDTLMLHVTSSRPDGKIVVRRAFNGRIYAFNCSKGKLVLDHITIEARNTATYDADICKNVAVTAVTIGANASMQMSECSVYASSDGNATAVGGSGNSTSAAPLDIHSCILHSEGRLRVYGIQCYSSVFVEECEINAVASGNSAYGMYVNNRQDTILMQDVQGSILDTRIRVSASKQAYGIYTYAPLNITNDSIHSLTTMESSYALYVNRDSAHLVLSHSRLIAESGYQKAYGANATRGCFHAKECLFRGTARLDTVSAKPTDSYARGVSSGTNGRLDLTRCTISAKGTNPNYSKGRNTIYAAQCPVNLVMGKYTWLRWHP